MMMSPDPSEYFRIEARELLDALTAGVLQLERGQESQGIVGQLLRHAHTLKGASRIVRLPVIADLSHQIEDLLAPYREGAAPPHETTAAVLKLIDLTTQELNKVLAPEATPSAAELRPEQPRAGAVDDRLEHVRIATVELDSLLRETGETLVEVGAISEELPAIRRAASLAGNTARDANIPGRVAETMEQISRELQEVESRLTVAGDSVRTRLGRVADETHRLRLVTADSIFPLLRRAIHDAAESLGKEVDFSASGGTVRLDAQVIRVLRDALVHVVRNSVAHGIESQAERAQAGKPARGRISVDVRQHHARVTVTCDDDGRGLALEKVRDVAVSRGLMSRSEAAQLEEDRAVELLLRGGLSTQTSVDAVSGRGVGLDVVRQTMRELKGELDLHSHPGKGMRVTLEVPVSLASLAVLEVESSERTVYVPADVIIHARRVAADEVAHTASSSGGSDAIVHEGKSVRLLMLEDALGIPRPELRRDTNLTVLVLSVGGKVFALGVRRLRRTMTVVMRPVPRNTGSLPLVAGLFLNSSGNPQVLISPTGIAEALASSGLAPQRVQRRVRPPVLVIDDSLTTRMLEQSILSAAGYETDTATSAEEALEHARQRAYGLFVVDVEMPGMNGFEFIERTRSDPELKHIPAILVTSRSSADDKARGLQVGAKAYIVKGEFEEGKLLAAIERLIG